MGVTIHGWFSLLHLVRCEEYLQRYCDGADLTQVEAVLVSSQFFSRKKRLHNYGKSSPCYQWVNHGKSTMSAISNKKTENQRSTMLSMGKSTISMGHFQQPWFWGCHGCHRSTEDVKPVPRAWRFAWIRCSKTSKPWDDAGDPGVSVGVPWAIQRCCFSLGESNWLTGLSIVFVGIFFWAILWIDVLLQTYKSVMDLRLLKSHSGCQA